MGKSAPVFAAPRVEKNAPIVRIAYFNHGAIRRTPKKPNIFREKAPTITTGVVGYPAKPQ
jgi:hypothetical protein